MAINLSGGKGIPSFEEWKKNNRKTGAGGSSASVLQSAEKKKANDLFDIYSGGYSNTAGLPLMNRSEIDNGAQRKAEQLKAAAEKLSKAPEWTAEEMKTLNQATALRRSGQRAEADALDSPIRNARRENAQRNEAAADKLKENAYYTGQAGIRTVGEKIAQSDPEYFAKAAAGYADKSNPIQKQRAKVISALPDGADYGVMGATLENQLSKIESGEKNGAIGTGLLNGMGGVNPADLTADELKTYSYWYQKSPNAAKRYLESISADVNKRTAEREAQFYSENSRELRDKGIGGTALALGRDLMVDYASPAAIASAAAAKLSGKPYDPNTSVNRVVTNSSAMQEGLTGDLPTLGKFLADTGISTAQYLARIPLGAAGLVVMASSAAGKTANEVKRSGGTTDQALMLGTVAGLAEYASEKIPFENIKSAFSGGEKKMLAGALEKVMKSKIGSVVGSTLEEGFEEVISEYINNIANDVVLGDASDMKQYALELISQGMSYEDATKAAFKQYYVTNPLVAFAGGALSGGVMAGVGETWANRRNIPRAIVNAGEENLRTQMQKNQAVNAEIPVDNKAAEVSVEAPVENAAQTETVNEDPQVMPKNQFANPAGNIVLDTAEQASRKQRANAAKTDVERSGILAGASDTDIEIAKSLSETFGRKIVFDSSDASVNGKFANGTIFVNPDGSDNVVTILAHELTHSAEGSEEYNTLKRCLKKNLADRGVMWSTVLDDVRSRYEYRYKRMGQEFTNDDCESEALALAAQALFSDNASMQEFVKQNRSAASRLWHKVSQAVERLKQDLSFRFGRGEKDEEARKRQLAIRQLEDARDALAAALRATEKNARMSGETSRNSFAQRKIPSYDELVAKPDMNIVDIGSEDTTRSFKEQRVDFMNSEEAKEIYKEPVVNRDTGERVFITPASFTHIFSDNARFKQNLARNIRAVLENAVLTHAEKATHGATNTSGVYTLFAAVRTDEGVKPVKIKVKEYINEGRELSKPIAEYFKQNGVENPYSSMYDGRVLELESVEELRKEAASSSAYAFDEKNSSLRIYPSTASTISIADFLPLVNSESKKYLPEKSDNSIKTDKTNYSLADSALSRAKQMEADGASPMTIKNATGWYRDDSRKWKKKWNKSSDMFSGEIPRTERSTDGGLNEALDSTRKASAMDSVTAAAKKFFGTTYDWNKTGYLLTDGSQLDFSGKHEGYDSGMRSVDHREIDDVYTDGKERLDALNDFLQKGNIRIMPESNGINLATLPTGKQEIALRRYINRVRGEVMIDIDDANGNTVKSLEYDSGTSAVKILDDIHQYFERGAGSESDIAMFHRMGDQYSVNNSQYGTKALNTAEEINRKKALDMLSKGKDPEHVFELTGWFYDNYGNFMVDHGAEMYSFGENDAKPAKKAENGKANTESEVKPKSEQLGKEALREAYRQGEREAQRAITKALNTDPDMMPDAKFVKGLVDDASGENVSTDKKREFTERLTELYDRMGDADANGVRAMSQQDIADSFNRLATDILDSREYIDGERERIQKELKKEFKTSMFVSPTARGDFAEGWNKVRKSYFGKLNLTSDRAKGVPVDVRYMELNQAYPEWFPDNIENETEQLEHMMNICDRVFDKRFAVESYYNFSGWENEYSKDHDDIVRKLSEGYRDLKQQPRTWYDSLAKRINDYRAETAKIHENEMKKLAEAAEKDAEEQLARYEQLMIETQKNNAEREQEIRDYYEGREQDRIDNENRARAEREARRRRRGGEIDMTLLNEALGDNTYTDKMLRLWDAQKRLSREVERYSGIDLDTLEDGHQKEYIKNIRERLDDMNTYINRVGQAVRRIKRREALSVIAKGDIMKWVDKKSGYLYSRETMRRNIEDISKGDRLGKEIIRNYIDPIQRDVALSTRYKESLRQRVKALDLGMKPTGNNELSESAFVQLLGEARDNIYMLENEYGADTRIGGERTREGKTLSQWQAILDTLMANNRDMDMNKIDKAIAEFQNIYDELFNMINNVRVLNGYAPADYHHGYFPHYNNDAGTDGIISSLFNGLGFNLDTEGLPTSINGLTHLFRPGTRYMSNLKQRSVYGVGEKYNGFTLNSGAVEGFDRYIETAADVIFLTGDIQNLRALSDAIRYSTTEEGVRNQVDTIRNDWSLTPQEQDSLIAELYDGRQKFHLRNFVIDLEEYTNLLAGKKSIKDRQWEQNFGRGMYQVMKKVEQRITANQIALNPGSWLTNFVPLAQAGSVLTPRQMLGAMLDTMKATMNDDGFATRSDFLTNRRGSESLVQTGAQKIQNTLSKPMEIIDGFTSETIVRARYAQNIAKGMTEAEAMQEADVFTNKLMANRAKGDMPTIFYASNPITKLFTMYQLEVNNQWSFMFKDLPKEVKNVGKNLAAMLFKLCIGSWLYNEIYEMIVGRRCAFDPIDMLNDFAGDLTGYKLPSISKALDTAFNPEKIGDLFKAKKVGVTNATVNLGKNAIEEAPFFGGIIGGGRIPISNALPNFGNLISSFDYSSEKAGSKRWEMRLKEGAKPLFYMLPPYGGGQIKKAIEGVAAFAQGGSYIRDNEGKKQLQYPVENQTVGQVATNLPRALLFGKTANKYGREWTDNGFGKYSAKATEAYQALVDDGISQADALKAVDKIKGEEKRAGKVKALREIGGSSEAKRAVFEKMILSSEDSIKAAAEKLDSIDSAGISFDNYLDAYDTYLSVSGDMRKLDVISTINRMKLSDSQKDILYCCFYKEGGLADTPWHSNGVMKAVLPEIGLPDITLPEIKMPDIKLPGLK